MAKVRTKKEHKKRVAKRNNILNQERKRFEKAQKEFFKKIIDDENKRGLFNNEVNPNINTELPSIDHSLTPTPNLGLVEGPKI
jgi:hypothetical protein